MYIGSLGLTLIILLTNIYDHTRISNKYSILLCKKKK